MHLNFIRVKSVNNFVFHDREVSDERSYFKNARTLGFISLDLVEHSEWRHAGS